MTNQITFYAGIGSPFTMRVEIALHEAKDNAVKHEIDYHFEGKPAWYTKKINPLGKFPAITYGPPHPIDQPAPDSVKINESLIIMEFIADLYPHAGLVPKDPVQRAKARVFVSLMDSIVLSILVGAAFVGTSDITDLYKAFDVIQSQLQDGVRYAVGDDFTIADIAAASHFSMAEVVLSNDLGKYKQGEGLKVYKTYKSAKYDKLRGYVHRLLDRPSVRENFHPELIKHIVSKKYSREA